MPIFHEKHLIRSLAIVYILTNSIIFRDTVVSKKKQEMHTMPHCNLSSVKKLWSPFRFCSFLEQCSF